MRKLSPLLVVAWLTACVSVEPLSYPIAIVTPSAETGPMRDRGDAADDPAIWVNPDDHRDIVLFFVVEPDDLDRPVDTTSPVGFMPRPPRHPGGRPERSCGRR